jgi:hypothetical protein
MDIFQHSSQSCRALLGFQNNEWGPPSRSEFHLLLAHPGGSHVQSGTLDGGRDGGRLQRGRHPHCCEPITVSARQTHRALGCSRLSDNRACASSCAVTVLGHPLPHWLVLLPWLHLALLALCDVWRGWPPTGHLRGGRCCQGSR